MKKAVRGWISVPWVQSTAPIAVTENVMIYHISAPFLCSEGWWSREMEAQTGVCFDPRADLTADAATVNREPALGAECRRYSSP